MRRCTGIVEVGVVDSGSTDLADLVGIVAGYEQVDVRIALSRSGETWEVWHGEVTLGGDGEPDRVWRYADNMFLEQRLAGRVVAAMLGREPQEVTGLKVAGLKVTVPESSMNGTFRRMPGQADWSETRLPWPRTEWEVSRVGSWTAQQGAILVGHGCPTFRDFEAAFSAFFYGAPASNRAVTHPLWRIRRLDRRAWLRRIRIAPDSLTVEVVGTDVAGVQLDLSWTAGQIVRSVGRRGRVQIRLRDGLPDHSMLALLRDGQWLDYRDFAYPHPGQGRDKSVVWDLPGVGVSLLLAGGEGLTVEFKREVPTADPKRNVLKTIAAFASGAGGTVLFGVEDDGQVVGISHATLGPADLDKIKLSISNMIRNNLDPEPQYDLRVEEYQGKTLLLVEVSPGGKWYAVIPNKPEFYVRRGASTFPARRGEIAAGFSQQSAGRQGW